MSETWKKDFPVVAEDDSYVTRREFTKFLGLTSIAFFIGTLTATARKLWKRTTWRQSPGLPVALTSDIPVGGYKLFRYPTEDNPCILLRLDQERFAAFNQNCTHLSCPVSFSSEDRQLVCPCHKGFFSAEDGRVLAAAEAAARGARRLDPKRSGLGAIDGGAKLMSPRVSLRQRFRVVLHMVMAFAITILVAQLWLFTVTLDAMENRQVSVTVAIAALVCSFLGCAAVWAMIHLFLRTEEDQ